MSGADRASTARGRDLSAFGKATGRAQGPGRVRQDLPGRGLVATTSTERKCSRMVHHRSDDDEPATFLFYVAHALQRACEGVGTAAIDLIQESFLINPRAIVSTLMNDLADVDDDVYLVVGGLPLGHQSRHP